MPQIEQWEVQKYWEIFSGLKPTPAGLLSGDKVSTVFKNSQLSEDKLAKIWDLADVDQDGNLDFEEFCIAMRIIYDIVNGVYSDPPETLPQWLVPQSKSYLVEANQAISGNGPSPSSSRRSSSYDDDEDLSLSSDFDWYISPSQRNEYNAIYSANADYHGLISFDALTELYQTLDNIPRTDISSAWNLVNPRSNEKIDKEQCIVFLHILSTRSKGFRIPRSVPASLRATFEKSAPEYSLNSSQSVIRRGNDDTDSSSNNKKSFANDYLTRLGLGGRSKGGIDNTQGTDFSSTRDTDWEEVRLKRQLADLEDLIKKAEAATERRKRGIEDFNSSKTGLLKRELEQLLAYKEKQLLALRNGSLKKGSSADDSENRALQDSQEEIDLLTVQIDSLKQHYTKRQHELETLRQQVEAAR
ncbi:uncharacterized protein SAPINGB_P001641 [Magnusiomyces paraingens]|uniref:Actin cytoskeleton-regulatory complex protein END3 n=1 Tax=Magnusiomyces paraingens TaxID=2606893 RepID=A0A5E8B6W9_9ASCO|nr:uncharacterized protein SAPINGB_P001641 [Saprochaete ingens]VVT47297.1 unnamed protein product [Saprochaete ingens]